MGKPGPKSKYPCPFSAARLHDLYWREQKTLAQIAAVAATVERWNEVPAARVAERWMIAANVPRRTLSQVGKASAAIQAQTKTGMFAPEIQAEAKERHRATFQPILVNGKIVQPAPAGSGPKSRATRAKISRTKQAQRAPDYWFVGTCDYCKKPVRKPRYRVKFEKVFCNRLCAARAAAVANTRKITRPCDYCGKPITRQPSLFGPTAYCGKSCANRGRTKKSA